MMHYGTQHTGFEKYKDITEKYNPMENKKNIFERKIKRFQMPATRDRYMKNPLAGLLQPSINNREDSSKQYHHDKLNISDI